MTQQTKNQFPVADLLAGKIAADTRVRVAGWVRTRRDSKAGISFVALSDGSCFESLQIVVPNTLENYESDVLRLTAGCSLQVEGKLIASPGQGQSYEVHADRLEVLGWVQDPDTYPMSPKHHTMEYLREYAHLRCRTNVIGAVARVQNCVAQALHRYFHEHGFNWIHTPIVTSSDCEGAGEMFRVSTLDLMNMPRKPDGQVDYEEDFFGDETFLTVSGQLHVESYCLALSKVYTFSPAFRAENSNTTRHLSEFWIVEPEIAFADLEDLARLAEEMLSYVCQAVLEERADDMAFFEKRIDKGCIQRLQNIIDNKFVHMEYSEAIEILKKAKKKFEFPVEWGLDLQSEHERYICEEYVHGPVILMNYPKDIKAFYMRQNEDDKTVAAMDVLVPGMGEIIGGSQREERLEVLEKRIDELGLNREPYEWYLDLRRYGTVPHAGFGLGFERFINYVTGITNIRDVIPFPRYPRHAEY